MLLLDLYQLLYYFLEGLRFIFLDFRDRLFLAEVSKCFRERTTFTMTFHFPLSSAQDRFADYLTQAGFEYELSITKTHGHRQLHAYINPKEKHAFMWFHRLRFQALLMAGLHQGESYPLPEFPILEPSRRKARPSAVSPDE